MCGSPAAVTVRVATLLPQCDLDRQALSVIDVAASSVRTTWSDRAVNDLVLDEAQGILFTLQHPSGGAYEMVAYELTTGNEVRRFEVDHKAYDLAVPGGSNRIFTTNLHRCTVSGWDCVIRRASPENLDRRGGVERSPSLHPAAIRVALPGASLVPRRPDSARLSRKYTDW